MVNLIPSKYLVPSLFLIVTLALVGGEWDEVWLGEEAGDRNGLLIPYAFATTTIGTDPAFHSSYGHPDSSDLFTFYLYADMGEIVLTPVVTSNITDSDISYTWIPIINNTFTHPSSGINTTSTLSLTIPPDTDAYFSHVLFAFDDDGSTHQVFTFDTILNSIVITIPGGDNTRQVSVDDSFDVPSATCAHPTAQSKYRSVSWMPQEIDTSTALRHVITYTCENYPYPDVIKTLVVNVGNLPPPGPLSLSVISSDTSVFEGGTITLNSSHTGGYGTPLTYSWSSSPDTAGVLSSTSTQNSTFTAPTVDMDTSYTITLEANDNTYSDNATVQIRVLDDPTPVVSIPGPNPLQIEYGDDYTAPDVTCSDNDDDATLILGFNPNSIDTRTPGDTSVIFTCTDSLNQVGTDTLTVRVLSPPPLSVTIMSSNSSVYESGDLELTSSHTGGDDSFLTYNWSSDPDTAGVFSSTGTQNSTFTAPTVDMDTSYTITLEANDNTYSDNATVQIRVLDDPTPVVSIPGPNPLQIEYGDDYTAPDVTCSDNDDDATLILGFNPNSIDTRTPGDTSVIFTCTDSLNQVGTDTLTVRVLSPPPLSVTIMSSNSSVYESGDLELTSSHTGGDDSFLTYNWSSDPDTVGVFSSTGTQNSTFIAPTVDMDTSYAITLVVSNNTHSGSGTTGITVLDDPTPVVSISGPNPLQIEYGDDYTAPDVTCSDNDDDATLILDFNPNSIDTRTPGDTSVIFTCTDSLNQVGTDTLTVRVLSPPPLSVTIMSSNSSVYESDTIKLTSSHTGGDDSFLTYNWSSDPDTAGVFSSTGTQNSTFIAPTVDMDTSYTITLEANDNTYSDDATVQIRVLDDPTPVVSIPGPNPLQIEYGDDYTAPDVTCSDNDDDATLILDFNPNSIDTRTPGDTSVIFTCTDSLNQVGTDTLTVRVLSPPPLSVTIMSSNSSVYESGDLELTSSHTGGDDSFLTYNWSSDPDTAGVFSSTGTQNSTFIAPTVDMDTSYAITLVVSNNTHSGSGTTGITVLDDPTPVVSIPGPNPLIIDYNSNFEYPTVRCDDNDADDITPFPSPSSIDTSVPADTHVIFTCTDSLNQVGTAILTVRVNSPENAPTVTISGSNPLHVPYDDTGSFTEPNVTCVNHLGVALDSSHITSVGTVDTSIPESTMPRQTITYTCTDDEVPGAKTLTVIVGEKPPTINQIDFSPVVERTHSFTPSGVVECSDDFNDDILVTYHGLNTQIEDTYPVTFTCTSPTTRLSTELVADVSVIDAQSPEFLSAKYTLRTGMLVITFNEDLASPVNPSNFTIRSQGETLGGLTLTNATLTTQNHTITITLTDEQKETFQTISDPHLFIAAHTISDTADSPNVVTDEITNKRIIVVKAKSGNSVSPPIVDLTALKASSFDVDIPESVLDILESYDQSSPIELVMEGKIIFSFPFVTDDICYALGGKINTIQPYQIGLNQPVDLAFTAYSSSGIDHFVMFLNLDGDDTSYTSSDTYITYLNGRVTIVDPHNYIADATITIEQDEEQSFQYTILTVIEFDGEMGLTNMVARIWNDNSRSTNIRIIDALNIVSTVEQSVLIEDTDATATTTTATNATATTETLAATVTDIESTSDDDDILHSIKMWAGFDSQSISDSELLEFLNLDYPDVDIPDWVMTELAVLVVSGDITLDAFTDALVFVLDAL